MSLLSFPIVSPSVHSQINSVCLTLWDATKLRSEEFFLKRRPNVATFYEAPEVIFMQPDNDFKFYCSVWSRECFRHPTNLESLPAIR